VTGSPAGLPTLRRVLPALEELRIRDIGVIDEVTLLLAPGLNVLTGETGAGKTMVVSALELLRGGRADADRVRSGATTAVVDGRIHPLPEGVGEWVGADDEDLVVSREVSAQDGGARSRARIGGRLAPVSALAEVMDALVEVHGQSDSARLSSPAVQRELLDRFGGPAVREALGAYQTTYRAWRAAEDELARLRADARDRAREIDRLRFELDEIDAVAPEPGEDERIDAELRRLEHAEALLTAAATAGSAITEEGAARDALGAAVSALRGVAGVDDALEELRVRAEGLAVEAQDIAMELGRYAEGVALDPERLEELRVRRQALAGLTRKYGADLDGVRSWADDARTQLERLTGGDDRAAALDAEVVALRAALDEQAAVLRRARTAAGTALAGEVEQHLGELAMAEARMAVDVAEAPHGPHGGDRITYGLAANAGEPLLSLAKAASGGERSRVALSIRLALADVDVTPVLVFDEVDAGIGGAVALQVGRKLARLARGRQVLCVTHLAQLAAYADAHFVVEKVPGAGADGAVRTTAGVRRLEEADRVVELSRMLSGSPDSAMAAGHAAELLAAAAEEAARP
jgi:DNA repair protein RecN (Recombination protein N)